MGWTNRPIKRIGWNGSRHFWMRIILQTPY